MTRLCQCDNSIKSILKQHRKHAFVTTSWMRTKCLMLSRHQDFRNTHKKIKNKILKIKAAHCIPLFILQSSHSPLSYATHVQFPDKTPVSYARVKSLVRHVFPLTLAQKRSSLFICSNFAALSTQICTLNPTPHKGRRAAEATHVLPQELQPVRTQAGEVTTNPIPD